MNRGAVVSFLVLAGIVGFGASLNEHRLASIGEPLVAMLDSVQQNSTYHPLAYTQAASARFAMEEDFGSSLFTLPSWDDPVPPQNYWSTPGSSQDTYPEFGPSYNSWQDSYPEFGPVWPESYPEFGPGSPDTYPEFGPSWPDSYPELGPGYGSWQDTYPEFGPIWPESYPEFGPGSPDTYPELGPGYNSWQDTYPEFGPSWPDSYPEFGPIYNGGWDSDVSAPFDYSSYLEPGWDDPVPPQNFWQESYPEFGPGAAVYSDQDYLPQNRPDWYSDEYDVTKWGFPTYTPDPDTYPGNVLPAWRSGEFDIDYDKWPVPPINQTPGTGTGTGTVTPQGPQGPQGPAGPRGPQGQGGGQPGVVNNYTNNNQNNSVTNALIQQLINSNNGNRLSLSETQNLALGNVYAGNGNVVYPGNIYPTYVTGGVSPTVYAPTWYERALPGFGAAVVPLLPTQYRPAAYGSAGYGVGGNCVGVGNSGFFGTLGIATGNFALGVGVGSGLQNGACYGNAGYGGYGAGYGYGGVPPIGYGIGGQIPPIAPVPPRIQPTCTITLSDSTIAYGGSTTLAWSAQNATSASLNGFGNVLLSSTRVLNNQTVSRTYGITVTGPGGTGACYVTLSVGSQEAAPTCQISANPTSIRRGESANLAWVSTNAKEAALSSVGPVPLQSGRVVSPTADTTYTLRVLGTQERIGSCAATVVVR